MSVVIRCDVCDDEVARKDACIILVQVPPDLASAHSLVMTESGPRMTGEPDRFEACAECACALVLSIKQGQLMRRRGERRV